MLQEPLKFTGLLDSDWRKIIVSAKIKDENKIDVKGFEVVLDEVLARTGFYDDSEDDDVDSILDEDEDDGMLLIDDLKS